MSRHPAMPTPETIHRTVLDNGLTVLVRENHTAPLVITEGYLPVGSIYDPADRVGLSSFVASLLTRGSKQYDYAAVNEQIESVGASLSVGSDVHAANFGTQSLSEDFPMLLTVLADALRHPIFPAEQIEIVRRQRLIYFQEREQDTRSMAGLRFRESCFSGHPYGRSVSGYPEPVTAISRQDLVNFHQQHYTPRGAILVVSGDVETQQAVDHIAQQFGDWQGPTPESRLPDFMPGSAQEIHAPVPGKVQSDIVIGGRAVARSHPDYDAIRVANTILGRFGMMGRLGETIREEQGLAYYAYSMQDGDLLGGAWSASAGVNPANVEVTVASMRREFARLAEEPVSTEELADSQAYMTGIIPLTLETNEGVASTLLNMEWFGLGLDYLERYRDLIYAVTPADVQRVAQRYLVAEPQITVIAGP